MKVSRRGFMASSTAALLAAGNPAKRVVILGFDGVDPGIVSEMMDKGELPHLAQLRAMGQFEPLASSNPPQSPTAWSNFSTCRTPLNHGVFDFLRRDPKTYVPSPGFGTVKRPEFGPEGGLTVPPEFQSHREGETFWKVASAQGVRVKALVVPFAYPADELSGGGCQLCGLDVRDLRGTQSTYFAFSEDFTQDEENVAGGVRMKLKLTGDTGILEVPGLRNPRGAYVRVPVEFKADRTAKSLTVSVEGKQAVVEEGEWSPWLEWTFPVTSKYVVRAISRFRVMEAGENVRAYMTCLQYHPKAPMVPISAPKAYAGELVDRYGLYKTVGWAYDTKALEKDDMNEDMFLEDIQQTMAWRERLMLDELERGGFDILVAAWTATDRVSHMFWRYRDPKHPLYTAEGNAKYGRAVEDTYIKMDEIVGEAMARLRPDDLLMLMSDHGFHSFRYGFSVNTWLVRNGYLTVRGQDDPKTAYTDEKYLIDFRTKEYHYDWSKTKAYGLGLGMIFLNRQGREGQGIVTAAEAPGLLAELKDKLLAVIDPATGDKVFNEIEVNVNPQGVAVLEAPDIQLGYAEGYQTEKSSAAGAAPKDLFSPNLSKWSGEHASSGRSITPGIFFSNKKLRSEPALADLGVTALDYLGCTPDPSFEGNTLLPK